MDAAFGTETEIEVGQTRDAAWTAKGNGCEPGHHPETCRQCGGSGQVSRSQGFFTVRSACPVCRGNGQMITRPCPECRGNGQVQVNKRVSVKIPAGVDNGSRLRLTGEGEPGRLRRPHRGPLRLHPRPAARVFRAPGATTSSAR